MGLISKIFLGILLAIGLVIGLKMVTNITPESADQECLFEKIPHRQSITFLLGTDKPGYQYFSLAEEHFMFDEKEKTDIMIKSCRSLEDMILFLNERENSQPWSTIQVVLHGNPYSGLSLPIYNEGPRATPKQLVKAIMENPLPKLEAHVADTLTRINFWGCGIGKNPFINIALDSFFQLPDRSLPKIYTAPHFVIFKNSKDGSATKRINLTYWPYFFKRGYRPSDAQIASDLATQFPEAEINWKEALSNEGPESEHFQNSFHIPVSWIVIYPTKESRPSVKSKSDKMEWIKSQPELMAQVEEMNIPLEKFNWTVDKRIHTNADGEKVPAIKGIGMATVMCVLGTESL